MRLTSWRKSSFSGEAGSDCVEVALWRKSSFSGQANTDCVEVALGQVGAAVRDSKNAPGPRLEFSPGAWRSLLVRLS
jgi:hypothetical protein